MGRKGILGGGDLGGRLNQSLGGAHQQEVRKGPRGEVVKRRGVEGKSEVPKTREMKTEPPFLREVGVSLPQGCTERGGS